MAVCCCCCFCNRNLKRLKIHSSNFSVIEYSGSLSHDISTKVNQKDYSNIDLVFPIAGIWDENFCSVVFGHLRNDGKLTSLFEMRVDTQTIMPIDPRNMMVRDSHWELFEVIIKVARVILTKVSKNEPVVMRNWAFQFVLVTLNGNTLIGAKYNFFVDAPKNTDRFASCTKS